MQKVISADSHISEIEDCFKQIDPAFEDRRPRQTFDEKRGAVLEIADLGIKIPMGLICTAGREPKDFAKPVDWHELHPAGHDPKERLKIQDEEGVAYRRLPSAEAGGIGASASPVMAISSAKSRAARLSSALSASRCGVR